MTSLEILEIGRQAILTLLKIAGPILAISLIVGIVISLLQALTQMQEMTLSFVPKIFVIFIAFLLLMPYMSSTLNDFTRNIFSMILK